MIRDSGAWELSEVMRLVPGMYVAYHTDNFYSADSIVTYHGLGYNRMQVLIDGRSVYSVLFGTVNWNDLPITLDDVERIEVVRGPASASYGSNSFAGVINIITQHPSETQGTVISTTYGTSRREGLISYGGQRGDLVYRFTIAARNDDGLNDKIHSPAPHKPEDISWTLNKYDNKKIRQLNWRSDYQVNANDNVETQFGYNGGPRQSGEYGDYQTIYKEAQNHFEQVRWRRALENNAELSVQAYHIQERINAKFADKNGFSNGDAIVRRYDLEVQHTLSPFKNIRMVYGANTRYDKVYAPYYLGGRTQYLFGNFGFHLNRLFGNVEWSYSPNLTFNIGATRESNSITGNDFTPRFATNWQFSKGQVLRAGYTRATRAPAAYEQKFNDWLRSPLPVSQFPALATIPDITPERVTSYELGYLTQLGRASIDVRLFDERFSDLIGYSKLEKFTKFTLNNGEARIRGAEMQVKWPIDEATDLTYGISTGGSKSPDTNGVIYSDTIARTTQSILVSRQLTPRWRASLAAYQVSKTHFHVHGTDANLGDERPHYLPLTRRWDARIAYNFPLMRKRAELALIAQNLGDARYFEYRLDNELPGRLTRLNLNPAVTHCPQA
jgi:iron complex outermembrane recepter protein